MEARTKELSEKYDIQELKYILQDYERETGSALAKKILANFADYIPSFKKILPNDYQKMLIAISKYEEQGISHDNAVLEAFEEVTA